MRSILLGTLAAVLTFYQVPAPRQPAAQTLTGRVLTSSATDAVPVRRARVTLAGGSGPARISDTDDKGVYRFDRLPPGDYTATVQKPGFVRLETSLAPDATLMLERGGAIEGVVADVDAEPIWSVVVSALQRQPDGKLETIAQVRTDDLGHYRLHSLPAGDYYVSASTDSTYLVRMTVAPDERRPEPNRAFYPAATSPGDAKRVRVSLGRDTVAVDVTLAVAAPVKDTLARPAAAAGPKGTAKIVGRVTDATSGRPIRNAQLVLVTIDGQRNGAAAMTDAKGRFSFPSLQPRRYILRAAADRYVKLEFQELTPGDGGKPFELRDGQEFTADIKLPRTSALEGVVLDEFGDPAPGVMVQAARKEFAAGRQRLMPVDSRVPLPITDDLGHYRLAGLVPGEYYVIGLPGDYADTNGVGGFAPTFYPGTTDAASAVPVAIALGSDGTARFPLLPTRTFSVSGMMLDAEGRPAGRGTLWLVTPDSSKRLEVNVARGSTGPDGRFVLRNVPQGSYTMQGFAAPALDYRGSRRVSPMAFGWRSLIIGDTDLENVTIEVTNGTALRGRVVVEDTSAPPPRPEQVRVTANAVEFDSAPVVATPPPSVTNPDLTFEVSKLWGIRRIFVTVSAPGLALKKIVLNEADVTDTPVDFRTRDVDGVEVVLTSKVSRVTGSVSDDKGAIADYAVIVFSSDPTKWTDRSRFVALARPNAQGRFAVRGLPPEDYLAVALPNLAGTEWRDPEVLQQLRTQATPFVLTEGESRSLNLKLTRRR